MITIIKIASIFMMFTMPVMVFGQQQQTENTKTEADVVLQLETKATKAKSEPTVVKRGYSALLQDRNSSRKVVQITNQAKANKSKESPVLVGKNGVIITERKQD